jgi:hypothetical protein
MILHALWDSVERISKLIVWANWGIAATLLGAFGCTVIAIKAGSRKDELTATEDLAKAKQIADTSERAGKLENQNLILRGQIANLELAAGSTARDLLSLQTAAADAKAAQQRVEIDLGRQQERAATAEKDLIQLRESIKDRHITPDQKVLLIRTLKETPKGKVEIRCPVGNPEARNLGLELVEVFKAGGWGVVFNDRVLMVPSPVGFKLWVHSEQSGLPEGATVTGEVPIRTHSVLQALDRAHLSVEVQFTSDVHEDDLVFVVGFKPHVQ